MLNYKIYFSYLFTTGNKNLAKKIKKQNFSKRNDNLRKELIAFE